MCSLVNVQLGSDSTEQTAACSGGAICWFTEVRSSWGFTTRVSRAARPDKLPTCRGWANGGAAGWTQMESTDKEGQRVQTGPSLSRPHAGLGTLLIHGLRRTEAQNQEDPVAPHQDLWARTVLLRSESCQSDSAQWIGRVRLGPVSASHVRCRQNHETTRTEREVGGVFWSWWSRSHQLHMMRSLQHMSSNNKLCSVMASRTRFYEFNVFFSLPCVTSCHPSSPPPPPGCGKAILSASVRCSLLGKDTEKIDECFDMESVRQTLLSGPPL